MKIVDSLMLNANDFVTSSISKVRIDYSFVSMAPRVVAFIGHSGSGKTTLIVELIPLLRRSGRSVGVIKHTHHEIGEISRGDSESFLASGADAVVLCNDAEALRLQRDSRGVTQLVERRPYAAPFDLPVLVGADLVLIEGFKQVEIWPRILVVGAREHPAEIRKGSFEGVVSDQPFESAEPRFDRSAISELALFVDRIAREA